MLEELIIATHIYYSMLLLSFLKIEYELKLKNQNNLDDKISKPNILIDYYFI